MIVFDRVWFSYREKRTAGETTEREKPEREPPKASLPFEGLTFHIRPGQRVAIRGPSGCGKTTLLRLAMGLERPDAGSVAVHTRNLSALFQENRLLPFRTVAENCALFCLDRAAVAETLRALGLADAADVYPSSLSGGMARRAALARALAHPAELYLFDEPFNGLDEAQIRRCAEWVNRVTAGRTVLLVSHRKGDAEALDCRTDLESCGAGKP